MKQKFDEQKFFMDLLDAPKFIFTSRDLAEYFGRPHSIIMRKIEQSIDDILERQSDLKSTTRYLFCRARYVTRGRKYPIYILTRTSLFFLINRFRRMRRFPKLCGLYESTMYETHWKIEHGIKVEDQLFAFIVKGLDRYRSR